MHPRLTEPCSCPVPDRVLPCLSSISVLHGLHSVLMVPFSRLPPLWVFFVQGSRSTPAGKPFLCTVLDLSSSLPLWNRFAAVQLDRPVCSVNVFFFMEWGPCCLAEEVSSSGHLLASHSLPDQSSAVFPSAVTPGTSLDVNVCMKPGVQEGVCRLLSLSFLI